MKPKTMPRGLLARARDPRYRLEKPKPDCYQVYFCGGLVATDLPDNSTAVQAARNHRAGFLRRLRRDY